MKNTLLLILLKILPSLHTLSLSFLLLSKAVLKIEVWSEIQWRPLPKAIKETQKQHLSSSTLFTAVQSLRTWGSQGSTATVLRWEASKKKSLRTNRSLVLREAKSFPAPDSSPAVVNSAMILGLLANIEQAEQKLGCQRLELCSGRAQAWGSRCYLVTNAGLQQRMMGQVSVFPWDSFSHSKKDTLFTDYFPY